MLPQIEVYFLRPTSIKRINKDEVNHFLSKPRQLSRVGLVWVIITAIVSAILVDIQVAEAHKFVEVVEVTQTTQTKKEVRIEVVYNWTPERIEKEIRTVFKEEPNTAVAVAKSESGGKLKIEIQSGNTLSYGREESHCTFQIHAPDWDGVAKKTGWGDYRTNPKSCVQLAYYIYKDAKGFTPWTEYKNGRYKKHL